MRSWGFDVNEETVVRAIRNPQQVLAGYSGRSIAQVMVDAVYVLRVVYEEREEILIITMYPGRHQRYAD